MPPSDSPGRSVRRCLAVLCLLAGLVATFRPAAAAAPPADDDALTILCYHEIATRDTALSPDYAVAPADFRRQMLWLRRSGYHFVDVDDVLADRAGKRALPARPVLVTFDDGYRSMYRDAYPVLREMRIPAVIALVGAWLDVPDGGKVDFDGRGIPRDDLLSWGEIREMTRSGLVEVASHTYAMHTGILSNPQGNQEPAATARRWLPASRRYEDEATYARRVADDLRRNNRLLRDRLGVSPRIVVWPYGRYNVETRTAAAKLGMPIGLTLDDGPNRRGTPLGGLRRILLERTTSLAELSQDIALRDRGVLDEDRPGKIMHIDLDYIYDPDEQQQEDNLGRLLERIVAMGANTVYLQAFSDPDANGAADAVYFPNTRVPMRADLFNRVAWQIQTRTQVKRIYAWMPLLAWQLPASDPAARDTVVTLPNQANHLAMGYPRLSPFSPHTRAALRDLYRDLARSTPIDGILFHDDVTLSDYEDGSPWALKAYRKWGLPGSVPAIRADEAAMASWTRHKTAYLDALASEMAGVAREEQPGLRTARNLYAQVVLNPRAEEWYSQSFDSSLAHYDYTAIMAMPYMEQADDPVAFLRKIVDRVAAHPGAMPRTVIELQTVDWRRDDRPLPGAEVADTIRRLYDWGVRNVAYYPDNLFENNPDPVQVRPVFGSKPNRPPLPPEPDVPEGPDAAAPASPPAAPAASAAGAALR